MLCLFEIRWSQSPTFRHASRVEYPVRKRFLIPCLKYGLGLGLLAYVVWRNWAPASGQGLQGVVQRHFVDGEPIHYGPLILASMIYLVGVLLTFVRWYVLVRAQELPFTLGNA